MKVLYRLPILLCLAALLLSAAAYAEGPPSVSAASYVLMEADSGQVLAEENADEPRLIASTTKIMTALLVLERCDPAEEIVIDPAWTGIEGSSMYLAPGQVLTVRDLLYGLMLASGNDAAVALACVAAGDVESFAALMNEKAAALGCENTHFENPNGLDGTDHHASARDLALITREALKNETFCEIVSSATAVVGETVYTNHNRLLKECEGVFGVKTGYTEAAGRTLVSCCERDGITLICVTLSDPDDWKDHSALYDWAYSEYVRDNVLASGTSWTVPVIGGNADEVSVVSGEALSVLRRQDDAVTLRICLPAFVYADVAEGDFAGTVTVYVEGAKAASAELYYAGSVQREMHRSHSLWERMSFIQMLTGRKIYTLI